MRSDRSYYHGLRFQKKKPWSAFNVLLAVFKRQMIKGSHSDTTITAEADSLTVPYNLASGEHPTGKDGRRICSTSAMPKMLKRAPSWTRLLTDEKGTLLEASRPDAPREHGMSRPDECALNELPLNLSPEAAAGGRMNCWRQETLRVDG